MSNFVLCRVCLTHNIRMYPIKYTRYQEIYEKYTGVKLIRKDRPNTICYICNSQLLKFYRFLQMSQKAEQFLTEIYRNGLELTQKNVHALENKLQSLSVTNLRSMCITDNLPTYEVEVITPDKDEDIIQDENIDIVPDKDEDITPDEDIDIVPDKDEDITPDEDIDIVPDKDVDVTLFEDIDIVPDKVKYVTLDEDINIVQDKDVDITPDEDMDVVTQDENEVAPDSDEEGVDVKIESVDYKEIDLAKDTDADDVSIPETYCNYESETPTHELYYEDDEDLRSNTSQISIEIEAPAFNKYNNPMEYLIEKKSHSSLKLPDVSVALERIPISSISQLAKKLKKQKSVDVKHDFYCKECSYKCNFKSILKKHMNVHDLKRAHSCKICNHRFRTLGNLRRHMNIMHRQHNECKVCSKVFTKSMYLHKHMLIHSKQPCHTAMAVFTCELCARKFNHKSTFLVHMRTHTGEKPFDCKWCGKTFNDKSNCRKHSKTHTGTSAKYPCFMCDRVFSQRSHLRKHAIEHIL